MSTAGIARVTIVDSRRRLGVLGGQIAANEIDLLGFYECRCLTSARHQRVPCRKRVHVVSPVRDFPTFNPYD
jgi:hypothetical protein